MAVKCGCSAGRGAGGAGAAGRARWRGRPRGVALTGIGHWQAKAPIIPRSTWPPVQPGWHGDQPLAQGEEGKVSERKSMMRGLMLKFKRRAFSARIFFRDSLGGGVRGTERPHSNLLTRRGSMC